MRKLICLIVTLVLCLSMVMPAMAAENEFVPSIEYKYGLEVIDVEFDGEKINPCLIVSSLKQAAEKTTDITQHDRDLLQRVYEMLLSGEMTLPLDYKYVIRDLVDVSFKYNDCRNNLFHTDKAGRLAEDGTTLKVTFKMGIGANEKLQVLVFMEGKAAARSGSQKVNGQWVPAKSVTNNGDGTVTVEFEDICPVAFVVEKNETIAPTGDPVGENLVFWVIAMVVCAAGIVVLTTMKFRKKK